MQRCLLCFTAVLAALPIPCARAADWYTGAEARGERSLERSPERPSDRSSDPDAWIVAVDASATVSSQGSEFAGATVTAAPRDSLLVSGPRVRLDGLIGSYRATDAAGGVAIGQQQEAAAMGGYAWVWSEAVLSGFVGLNLRRNELSGATGATATDRIEVGLKTALDFYARPTATTMVHATGSYATTFNAYFGRVRAGTLAFAGGYLGPEVALLGDDYYRQWRAGAHLSGLQVGALQFGISAGYLHDHARKGGLYTTVDLRAGF